MPGCGMQSASAMTMPLRSTLGIATSSMVAMKSSMAASWMKRTGSFRPAAGWCAGWSATFHLRLHRVSDATGYNQRHTPHHTYSCERLLPPGRPTSAGGGVVVGGIDAAQHFLEVILHRLVAEAGPD